MNQSELEKLAHDYVGKLLVAVKNHEGDVHRYFVDFHKHVLSHSVPAPDPAEDLQAVAADADNELHQPLEAPNGEGDGTEA